MREIVRFAKGEAHKFRPNFPFCDHCQTHECGRRMASLLRKA